MRFQPTPPGLADTEAHRVQARRRVSVCRYGDPEAHLLRLLAMNIVEVEAGRVCIQFKETSTHFRPFHHAVEVDRVA